MLIGFHGKMGAGKDTCYERLVELFPERVVRRASFADPLYKSAAAALGVTVEELRKWKNNPYMGIWVRDLQRPGNGNEHHITFREYLQRYGTEAHREVFGDNFWVDIAVKGFEDHFAEIVCVTDVRFENEAQAIQDCGGYVVRVLGMKEETGEHASERPLPVELIDWVIKNDSRDDGFWMLDGQLRHLVATIA